MGCSALIMMPTGL